MLKLPRAAEREYLAIYGNVAIYVAALPQGGSLVGCSRDLLHSLLTLRRRWPGLQITAAFWVKNRSEASLISNEVTPWRGGIKLCALLNRAEPAGSVTGSGPTHLAPLLGWAREQPYEPSSKELYSTDGVFGNTGGVTEFETGHARQSFRQAHSGSNWSIAERS